MLNETTGNQRLAGRRILITGAASGIGCATAELFVREGAQVALLDQNPNSRHPSGKVTVVDITDEGAVTEAVDRAGKEMGGIDGVVNAAGIGGKQTLEQTDLASWTRTLTVNLTGAMLVTRAALPYLKAAGNASIVNVASGIGLRPFASTGAYAASKAGLIAWTRVLAQELGPRIRANSICPGLTDTPLIHAPKAAAHAAQTQDNVSATAKFDPVAIVNAYALQRLSSAEEQASAILFLMSAESSFVTGVALAVDGGRSFH